MRKTLRPSIKTWEYFVDWGKVFDNVREVEIALNKLNYLVGKPDLGEALEHALRDDPSVVRAFPLLIAVRDQTIDVFDQRTRSSQSLDFRHGRPEQAPLYMEFIKKSGLERLFGRDGVKNLVDYVMGVEVGLDTNGRKNRTGKKMEEIVGGILHDHAEARGLQVRSQMNAARIAHTWGIHVEVDKSSRSFDFAVFNPANDNLTLVETNFYNGGGSKLKSTCGEYRTLQRFLESQRITFVWVTDGKGWETTLRPLQEAFSEIPFLFNLQTLIDDGLEQIPW
ncbi:MAG: type II restriction endonuclease [Trueperaceae bacterium]|nr:type II restriction endonuclease [Trueperaceae bacterium]